MLPVPGSLGAGGGGATEFFDIADDVCVIAGGGGGCGINSAPGLRGGGACYNGTVNGGRGVVIKGNWGTEAGGASVDLKNGTNVPGANGELGGTTGGGGLPPIFGGGAGGDAAGGWPSFGDGGHGGFGLGPGYGGYGTKGSIGSGGGGGGGFGGGGGYSCGGGGGSYYSGVTNVSLSQLPCPIIPRGSIYPIIEIVPRTNLDSTGAPGIHSTTCSGLDGTVQLKYKHINRTTVLNINMPTTMYANSTVDISYTFSPVDNYSVLWTTSDPRVINFGSGVLYSITNTEVNNSIKLFVLNPGNCTITSTTNTGTVRTYHMSALPVPVTSMYLQPHNLNISLGSSCCISSLVFPSTCTDTSFTWSSSNNFIDICAYGGSAYIKAKQSGTSTITCTNGLISCSAAVNVSSSVAPISISLNVVDSIPLRAIFDASMYIGKKYNFLATVYPQNVPYAVRWSAVCNPSQDINVTPISTAYNGITGGLMTLSTGSISSVTVTATVNNTSVSITKTYIINNKSLMIYPEYWARNETNCIYMPFNPMFTAQRRLLSSETAIWSSSDATIVSVDVNGVCTAIGAGICIITGSSTYTGTATLQVQVISFMAIKQSMLITGKNEDNSVNFSVNGVRMGISWSLDSNIADLTTIDDYTVRLTPTNMFLGVQSCILTARCRLYGISVKIPVSIMIGNTTRYDYTGTSQYWKVPASIYTISVQVAGGNGGYSEVGQLKFGRCGYGGLIKASVDVSPGDLIYMYAGGAGMHAEGATPAEGMSYGGGGSSQIFNLDKNLAIIAGGGGGACGSGSGGDGCYMGGPAGGNGFNAYGGRDGFGGAGNGGGYSSAQSGAGYVGGTDPAKCGGGSGGGRPGVKGSSSGPGLGASGDVYNMRACGGGGYGGGGCGKFGALGQTALASGGAGGSLAQSCRNTIFMTKAGTDTSSGYVLINYNSVILDKISLTCSNSTILVGDTARIVPIYPADQALSWTTNAISILNVDTSGNITGIAAGAAIITATSVANNVSASLNFTVKSKFFTKNITINTPGTLYISDTSYFTCKINPVIAGVIPSYPDVTWYSSSANVISVTTTGIYTANATGSSIITCRNFDSSVSTLITVNTPIYITSILIPTSKFTTSLNKVYIPNGQTLPLVPVILPANATSKLFTVSANTDLTVSGNVLYGTCTGGKITLIPKKYPNPNSVVQSNTLDVCSYLVNFSFNLPPASQPLAINASLQIVPNVLSSNNYTPLYTWKSATPMVASVNASGIVLAKASGASRITATTQSGLSSTYVVNVVVPLISISPVAGQYNISLSRKSVETTVKLLPINTTNKGLQWSSNDPTVATVKLLYTTTPNNTINLLSRGKSVITVTSPDIYFNGSGLDTSLLINVS